MRLRSLARPAAGLLASLTLGAAGCTAGDAPPPNDGIPIQSIVGGGGQAGAEQAGGGHADSAGHGGAGRSGAGPGGAPGGGAGQGASGGITAAGSGGASGTGGAPMSAGGSGGSSGASAGSAGQGGSSVPPGTCPVTFSFTPPGGATNPRVAGEWNGFTLATATPLTGPDAAGAYRGTVNLPVGLSAYKIIYDQNGPQWVYDPLQGRRKFVGSPPVENSAVKVADCSLPGFTVTKSTAARTAPGQGTYQAALGFQDGIDQSGPDAASFEAVLQHDDASMPLSAPAFAVDAAGNVTLSLSGLADGKYTARVTGKSKNGKASEPLRLVFWIEPKPFDWRDALIYMIVTDRFVDGDPTNNQKAPTPGSDPRGDFQGGDYQGVTQAINDGTLDKLGVRAIWMTPFQQNPPDAFPAADNVHNVTGYHGYWPIKARTVEPRWGGEQALHDLVKAAHAHGIRILQDYVVNHVHQEHDYLKTHPEYFYQGGCLCGSNNCDWTAHARDCLFATYMPKVNHHVPEATAAWVDDAVWWLDGFDLDGLRMDAVKHVEDTVTRNIAAEVREQFERAGNKYFLMGETAMGWDDCNPSQDPNCNAGNYGTISQYIGPLGLDGQFDFVIYHGVSYRTFAYGDKGMLHADFWVNHGQQVWPKGSIMTPYIGSHDTARFSTLAEYRDNGGPHDRGIPNNQWDNTAVAPTDAEPFTRIQLAFAWLLGLPGAPLMYYGDEHAQWGGVDPNNRNMWKPEATLDPGEKATLDFVRKVGSARQNIEALRRGDYVPFTTQSTDDTLVFGRMSTPGIAAVVGLTRGTNAVAVSVEVTKSLGLAAGTVLHDALGGPDATVAPSGQVIVSIPARSAAILAP